MTANVITYRRRSALRDVDKALGLDEQSLARVASLAARGEWGRQTERSMESNFETLDLP